MHRGRDISSGDLRFEQPSWSMQGAFAPDGKQVVAGLSNTSIAIWDVRPTD
jgi:hypothetical protein